MIATNYENPDCRIGCAMHNIRFEVIFKKQQQQSIFKITKLKNQCLFTLIQKLCSKLVFLSLVALAGASIQLLPRGRNGQAWAF